MKVYNEKYYANATLPLAQAVDAAGTWEAAGSHTKEMSATTTAKNVHFVHKTGQKHHPKVQHKPSTTPRGKSKQPPGSKQSRCVWCGKRPLRSIPEVSRNGLHLARNAQTVARTNTSQRYMCKSAPRQASSRSVHQVEEHGSQKSIYGFDRIQQNVNAVHNKSGKKYFANLRNYPFLVSVSIPYDVRLTSPHLSASYTMGTLRTPWSNCYPTATASELI